MMKMRLDIRDGLRVESFATLAAVLDGGEPTDIAHCNSATGGHTDCTCVLNLC